MIIMNKKMRITLVLAAFALPLVAAAAFTPTDWQWKKAITLPSEEFSPDAYVKIDLDQQSSIYSQFELADLRVVRDGSTEIPYQLITDTTQDGRKFFPATILDRAIDNGDMVLVIDTGEAGQGHNAIDIISVTPNFRRQVSIYSSDVLLKWSDPKWGWINPSSRNGALVRSTDAFIYHFNDTELSFSAGNSTVFYPETSSRYLRVVIHKENEKMELLGISVVRVYRDTLPVNKEDEMSVSATIGENQKEQSTEIIIDLGGGGLSTKAITLNLKDGSNFNRRATIHGSANGENWSLIG